MMTSTRWLPEEGTTVSLEDSIKLEASLRRPWCTRASVPEIIAYYQAENEPTGADRSLQRTADLRFPNTRIVAHGDFNHAESGQRAFQDHLHCPAVRGFFERERA